jgi:KDO2-lipid IV(A) lauroyltransferase
LQYFGYKLAEWLSRTPPRHFAYWLSLRISDLYYFLDRRGREAVMDNLRHVYAFRGSQVSVRELKLSVRLAFQCFGKYLVDFFRFSRLTEEDIRRLVVVEHSEYIEQARALGKGVVMVTAHLGNWELGGAVLASMGYPINAVVLKQPSAKLNEFFQKHRRQRGMNIVPLGRAAGVMIQALHRNELVAVLADRDYSMRNDFVSFCGMPACLPRGPAWVADKTGAPVVPGFMLRQADDTFVMRLYPPIIPGAEMNQEAIQKRICECLEHAVCGNPSQWFMFEKVWNGRSYGTAEAMAGGKKVQGGEVADVAGK